VSDRPGLPAPIAAFNGGYGFLSNFAPSPVVLDDGLRYPTAEHAFQAQKSGDIADRMHILHLTPAEAKRAGRELDLVSDWNLIRKRVMSDVVMAKFWQNPRLGIRLIATGDADLIEGNYWHDNYWGDCACGRARCQVPGLNYLGQALMWVRAVLRED
jgi:N-glycosidase YbiA